MLSDLAAVTPEQISALGLEIPDDLPGVNVPLWRSSQRAKYHWADERSPCQHLPGNRHWQHPKNKTPPPVFDHVAALGFAVPATSVCSACADSITISAQADAFIAVAAELVRAQHWLEVGRQGAAERSWSWLQFARWKARQPLLGARWEELTRAVRGKHWAAAAVTLRGAVATHRQDAEAVAGLLVASIGDDSARSAVLERAVRMVETESPALQESATVLKISGCHRAPDAYLERIGVHQPPTYEQPSPWHVVAAVWKGEVRRCGSVDAQLLADHLDDKFPHVHDLHTLHCCALHDPPFVPGDCLHTWALRTAQAHRRALVEQWLNRLDMAYCGLLDVHRDASDTCTHLVCIPWWPLIDDGMDSIAYLSQFDVVCGPFQVEHSPYEISGVAVVRVPGWAAAHAAELRSPLRCEPVVDQHRQAIALVREHGVAVVSDEFTARRKPSNLVLDARRDMDQPSHPGGFYRPPAYRPLVTGAAPPPPYDNEPWSAHAARRALHPGAEFIYGHDDTKLLAMALPPTGHWRVQARVHVELQTRCTRPDHDDEPHLCEVDAIIEAVQDNGALVVTPNGMRDSVTIPPAYITGLTFR